MLFVPPKITFSCHFENGFLARSCFSNCEEVPIFDRGRESVAKSDRNILECTVDSFVKCFFNKILCHRPATPLRNVSLKKDIKKIVYFCGGGGRGSVTQASFQRKKLQGVVASLPYIGKYSYQILR